MVNYKTLNFNITGDPQKVQLWQNRLLKEVERFNCTFTVKRFFAQGFAQVKYQSQFATDAPPEISMSEFLARADNKAGVYAMLHEIGHVIDYRKHNNSFKEYIGTLGLGEAEISAWEHAFRMAHKIGFSEQDFKEMHEHALQCLYTYSNGGTHFGQNADFMNGFNKRPHRWEVGLERMDKALKDSLKRLRREKLGV